VQMVGGGAGGPSSAWRWDVAEAWHCDVGPAPAVPVPPSRLHEQMLALFEGGPVPGGYDGDDEGEDGDGARKAKAAKGGAARPFADVALRAVDDSAVLDFGCQVPGAADVPPAPTVPAHKLVLALRSRRLRAMLVTSGMRESRRGDEAVPLHGMRPAVLRALLRYLYCDTADVAPQVALELLVAAKEYTLDRLALLCEGRLLTMLDPENAAEFLLWADTYDLANMRVACVSYILRHYAAVTATEAYRADLPAHLRLEVQEAAASGSNIYRANSMSPAAEAAAPAAPAEPELAEKAIPLDATTTPSQVVGMMAATTATASGGANADNPPAADAAAASAAPATAD